MKIGIAISTFDKFDELSVLHDIFRHNFKKKYYLYVCSNHPKAESEISKRGLIFDGFVQGDNIPYNNNQSNFEKRVSIVCRSTDTVQKSCNLAMENTDYVMHIHCDAWPLDEEKLINHFNSIIDTGYDVAFRGLGYATNRMDAPLGHVDDHFFIFNSKVANKTNLFNFNALDFLPHKLTIHGILTLQLLAKIGMNKILFFDIFNNDSEHECWKNEKKIFPFYPVKPSLIDNERMFIHIHTASFPENQGKQLQTFYLKSSNLSNGIYLNRYKDDNPCENDLHEKLSIRLNKVRNKAKRYGLEQDNFGQDIMYLENTLSKLTVKKILLNYTFKKINKLLLILGLRIIKNNDPIWPVEIFEYYKKNIKTKWKNSFFNQ